MCWRLKDLEARCRWSVSSLRLLQSAAGRKVPMRSTFSIVVDAIWLHFLPTCLLRCLRWDVPLTACIVLSVFLTCCCSLALAEAQCAGCTSAIDQDDQLRRLRIEATKRLILDRLEMDERPSKMDAHERISLPSALDPPPSADDEQQQVGQIRQLILFPTKMWPPKRSGRSSKFQTLLKFYVTDEMRLMALHSAVLWTADQPDDSANSTEVRWRAEEMTSALDQQIDRRIGERYLSLPLDTRSHKTSHLYRYKPYLVVQIDPHRKRRPDDDPTRSKLRRKRSTPTCTSNATQCCRESLYVSFRDIGWDDWIIAPDGFHAYYCRGSCRTSAAPSSSASSHASVLQKLLARDRLPPRTRSQLSPCCAPTRFASLTVMYTANNGDVVKQRDLPNMIVESCGCAL